MSVSERLKRISQRTLDFSNEMSNEVRGALDRTSPARPLFDTRLDRMPLGPHRSSRDLRKVVLAGRRVNASLPAQHLAALPVKPARVPDVCWDCPGLPPRLLSSIQSLQKEPPEPSPPSCRAVAP